MAESIQRQVESFAETQTSLSIVVPRVAQVVHGLRRGKLELRWHSCCSTRNPADDHTNAYEEESFATLTPVILIRQKVNTLVLYIADCVLQVSSCKRLSMVRQLRVRDLHSNRLSSYLQRWMRGRTATVDEREDCACLTI
jgi:hypothetical protein